MCSACQVEKRDEASGGALLMNNNNKSDMMMMMMPGKGASGGGRADVRVLQSPQLKKKGGAGRAIRTNILTATVEIGP